MSCHGPREKEPSFTDGLFVALALCLVEGLRVRKGGVLGTLSALEANDSQEDSVVRRSQPSEMLSGEGPRHPYSRVSLTSAFSIRTFRLSEAVVPSYNSGPNRLKHAHMRRIRRSISNERSALWMTPPRYKNRFVYLYLWSAASMTIGGTRGVLTTGATAVVSNAGV